MKKNRSGMDGYEMCRMTALFLFLFAGPLIVFKPAYDYTLVKNLAGFLFCILLAALFIAQKKEFIYEKKSFAVFLAFAFWVLLLSLNATFGRGAARTVEDYLLYFLIFTFAMNVRLKKQDVYMWIAAGIIASLTALFNIIGPRKYVVSTFGNPNFFAGHVMMLTAIAFSLLFARETGKKERYLLTAFLAITFIGILATRSRAAIFASVFGIATVMFLIHSYGVSSGNGPDPVRILKKWSGYAAVLLGGLAAYPRIAHWISTNIRLYIWRGALDMIKARPLTGWGPGNFPFIYPYYRIREYFLQNTATPVTIHVHNEYLQVWAEAGIVGLALFLGLVLVIIWSGTRKYSATLTQSPPPSSSPLKGEELGKVRGNEGRWEGIFIMGCAAAITAVLVDNLFSTNLRNPSTAMYFWFLAGTCAGYAAKSKIRFNAARLLWYAAGGAAFIMCVFTSFYRIMPEIYLKRGIWARESGRMKDAIENYRVVCSVNPHNYEAFYKMAFAYGESGKLEEAKTIYLTINRYIFPHFAKTDTNLGTVYLRQGDFRKALYHYKWADWLNPYDIDVLCGTASIYLMFYNDVEQAVGYLNRVLTIDPENGYANGVLKMLKEEGKL